LEREEDEEGLAANLGEGGPAAAPHALDLEREGEEEEAG
jgi:hypothetical protein